MLWYHVGKVGQKEGSTRLVAVQQGRKLDGCGIQELVHYPFKDKENNVSRVGTKHVPCRFGKGVKLLIHARKGRFL